MATVKRELTSEIYAKLDEKNIPHSLDGYHMIAMAVKLIAEDRYKFKMMHLYTVVGARFGKAALSAERNIRYAISCSNAPCKSAEFLCRLADEIIMEGKNEGEN